MQMALDMKQENTGYCSDAEAEICRTGLSIDSDVYVMGHHGSGGSTSWELLQESAPEYAVLSCGAGNSYGHPHVESMEKLRSMGIELLRTDDNDIPAQPATQASTQVTETTDSTISVSAEYILNTSSQKIHYPNCKSDSQMKEKNKKATSESKDALLAQGYTPCKNCKP